MMERQSARLRWLTNGALAILMGTAAAGVLAGEPLNQRQLSEPDVVAQWLRDNPEGVDKKGAAFSFNEGLKYKSKKYWSAAAKSFGESAIRNPTPQVLTEYVAANLRMLGEIRARNGNTSLGVERDMDYALMQYQTVMAAHNVLGALSAHDKTRVEADIACLTDYARTRLAPAGCQPFELYGMQP